MTPSAVRDRLYWVVPPAFALWVYWSGLHSWFVADDFVWLALLNDVHSWRDLWRAIFEPTVQGTLRPWSDRVFFLVFRGLFDFDALPYHALVFATQMGAAALMVAVVRRLTGSKTAAFLAPIFWTGNAVLVMTMAWACLYKDVLCCFSMLLAFYFLLRFIETGARRYNVYQWVVFILGFGAMETNLIYPAIAIGYTALFRPNFVRKALPLAIPSAIYLLLSWLFVPKPAAGPYAMHVDRYLPVTFLKYWVVVLSPTTRLDHPWPRLILPAVFTLAIVAFVVLRWRRNDRLPALFLFWFLLTIGPVLPLREQFQTYYLTVASAGLAMLAAHALALAWETRRWHWRLAAAAIAVAFLVPSIHLARHESRSWRARGRRAEAVVLGVRGVRDRHPDWAIFLDRVDTTLFWDIFPDGAFRAAAVSGVYLTPSTLLRIRQIRPSPAPSEYALPIGAIRDLDRIAVFDAAGIPLKEITRPYLNSFSSLASLPTRVDLTSALFDPFLGGTWHNPEPDHRWMGKQASVRLAAPSGDGRNLHIVAYCPDTVLAAGPVSLEVSVNGVAEPPVNLRLGSVQLRVPLPPDAVSRQELEVTLRVSRTFRAPGDHRDLGLPIVAVEVR